MKNTQELLRSFRLRALILIFLIGLPFATQAYCDFVYYHGTSMFYLEHILKNGLDGKYPEELFKKIERYWPYLRGCEQQHKAYTYVPGFLERQRDYHTNHRVSLSFTPRLNVAQEFAGGERTLGEGPGYFAGLLAHCLTKNKVHASSAELKEMQEFSGLLNAGKNYPNIVLAIRSEKDLGQSDYEVTVRFPLSPEDLYILDEDFGGKLIQLKSTEGAAFIESKMEEFHFARQAKEEQQRKLEKYHHFEPAFLQGEKGYALLNEALDDPDPTIQTTAAWGLSRFKGAQGRAVALYGKAFRSPIEQVRASSASSLGYYEGEEASAIFQDALENGDVTVRGKIILSIAQFQKRGDAFPLILRALSDPSPVVRRKAAFELSSFQWDQQKVLLLLDIALKDEDEGVRNEALGARQRYFEMRKSNSSPNLP